MDYRVPPKKGMGGGPMMAQAYNEILDELAELGAEDLLDEFETDYSAHI